MKVLVSGSSGLIGSALIPALEEAGHTVIRLVRAQPEPGANAIHWDPADGSIDRGALEQAAVDAVVHLAGENIAAERWTPEHKNRVRDSRVKGTRILAETLAELPQRPRVFASASAIGYYGDRNDEALTEDSRPGTGFLPTVCRAWESAAQPASQRGIRTVNLRIGIVLSAQGGILAKTLPYFRMGVGGPYGSGKQWMSWIAIDDIVGAILHTLNTEIVQGPVNLVGPNPVRNAEFARTLGKVLSRPAFLPAPAFALRAVLGGEMANELLLSSQKVEPKRLQKSGYVFRYPELEAALRHVLGK